MIKRLSAAVALALLSNVTTAAEIKFRGFASIVGGSTLSSDETLYNYTDALDFQEDSLIALQAEATLSDRTTATMQLLARGERGYEPQIEWAYLSHQLTDTLKLSAGRMRIPFFRYSDFMDVRYAYNWIEAPQTVYSLQLPGYDGVSLLSNNILGSWDSSLQIVFGQMTGDVIAGAPGELENLVGGAWTLTRDWLTLRANYISSKAIIDIPEYTGLIALVDGAGAATSTDVSDTRSFILIDGDRGQFFGLALGIDFEGYLLDAETIKYEVEDSLTPETEAWYITAGYRFGSITPHLTYSELTSDANREIVESLPAGVANVPIPDAGNATVMQILGGAVAATAQDIKLTTLGVRYDVSGGIALKMSFTQQEDITGEKSNLLRFGADVVF